MGLFDDLRVEHPLPDGFDPTGTTFQTKDLGQTMDLYVLGVDGVLRSTTGEDEKYDGALQFSASNWSGTCGPICCTRDDQPPWRADYMALFDRGRLLRIDGPGRQLEAGVEHVLRADFDRRAAEWRASMAKPWDDLWSEWLDLMTSALGDPFEAVKLPAVALRLSHLRGQCAWSNRTDSVQDLRNWAAWLGQEPGLTPELADLLERTKQFLMTREEG